MLQRLLPAGEAVRTPIPNRRPNLTSSVAWSRGGPDQKLIVTFGFARDGSIREVFCAGFRADTDFCALVNDACIMMSWLLQLGVSLDAIVDMTGEDRSEGARSGPPSSIIGAIARCARDLSREAKP